MPLRTAIDAVRTAGCARTCAIRYAITTALCDIRTARCAIRYAITTAICDIMTARCAIRTAICAIRQQDVP